MKNNLFKIILFSGIILVAVLLVLFFIFNLKKDNKKYIQLKNYKSNEYIPTYVSNEDMAKIYLNDYTFYVKYDMEKSYNLLSEDYRKAKFSSFNDYKTYIVDFINKNPKPEKFSTFNKNGYIFYKLYLTNDYIIIFRTKGVMQYNVYLDEDTIEIR